MTKTILGISIVVAILELLSILFEKYVAQYVVKEFFVTISLYIPLFLLMFSVGLLLDKKYRTAEHRKRLLFSMLLNAINVGVFFFMIFTALSAI